MMSFAKSKIGFISPYSGFTTSKYFDVVKPEYGDMKPIFDLAKEIMAGVEKK